MSIEVVLDSPLAKALNATIQPKLVEVGWSTGADVSELAEYIILMLVNGKTQEQIAAELSVELLSLGDDDPGAKDFALWLFQQVADLNNPQNGGDVIFPAAGTANTPEQLSNAGQDAIMGDASDLGDVNVPTGPKSMRNGPSNRPRDKRMLGHLSKAMDRTGDSVLHRVRPQNGNERINTHSRGTPTGPRQQTLGRGTTRVPNSRPNGGIGGMPLSGTASNVMNMTAQQQVELYAMLEQQSRLMAQMLGAPTPQAGMGFGGGNGGHIPGSSGTSVFQQQHTGRSLFDRVQPKPNPQRPQQNSFNKHAIDGRFKDQLQQSRGNGPSTSVDVEMSQHDSEPSTTICTFNLKCTKPECPFAHQSPAAPPGITIDIDDVCSFGAACKNTKCVGRHPSPAKKFAHQADTDCRYATNCTKPNCPFRHPPKPKPLCHNGANCSRPGCPFTHTTTMCMFNPCTRPTCPYKHEEGQQRPYEDKVWVASGAQQHVSERKFVDESKDEELIKPTPDADFVKEVNTAELIT